MGHFEQRFGNRIPGEMVQVYSVVQGFELRRMEIFQSRILGEEVSPGFIASRLRLSRAGPRDEKQKHPRAIPWRFSKTGWPPIRSIMRGPALGLVERPGVQTARTTSCFHYGMLHHARLQALIRRLRPLPGGDPSDLLHCRARGNQYARRRDAGSESGPASPPP